MAVDKKKLRKVLKVLSPEDKASLEVADLRDELKDVEKKIPTVPDYSAPINHLKESIISLQENIFTTLDELPKDADIEKIKADYLKQVEDLQVKFDSAFSGISGDLLSIEGQLNASQVQTQDDLDEINKTLKTLRLEIANKGGGSMNRQIRVKSSVMSSRYTDINFQNSTTIAWTATDDTTNKRVNITASLISGGGSSGSVVTSISKSGSAGLVGNVTLSEGSNISLTQSGQDIQINSTSVATPPGGADTTVQYNNGGTFDGTNLTYDNSKAAFNSDVIFADNAVPTDRRIEVQAQTTFNANGTNLVVKAGDGNARNAQFNGGDLVLQAGDAIDNGANDGFGGNVVIKLGKQIGGQDDGYLKVYVPTNNATATNFYGGLTGDRNYTWPNNSGTVALTSDIPATGANTALSNLTTTAINSNLLPGSVVGINLGSSTLPFSSVFAQDAYMYRNNRAVYANPTNNVWYFGSQGTASALSTNNNIGIGKGALDALTSIAGGIASSDNVGIGLNALGSVTTGLRNVAIGTNAMAGGGLSDSQTAVAIGYQAVFNVSGNSNVAIGANAMSQGTGTGTSNVAIGINCLRDMTNGNDNLGLGSSTLLKITTAAYNTAYGSGAMSSITAGSRNVGIGRDTLSDLTGTSVGNASSDNIGIGYNTGRGITTGQGNVIIGAQVTGLPSILSNNIILADGQGNVRYRYAGGTTSIFGGVGITGKITAYNSSVTAGMGVPAIYGARPTSASIAGNTSVIAYVPTSVAGMYRTNGVITTTSGTNTGTLQLTLDYVDSQGTTHTGDIIPLNDSASGLTASSVTGASKEFDGTKSFTINNSGTVIALKVVTSGSVSYTAAGIVEQLI